jgi:hypothetical protein
MDGQITAKTEAIQASLLNKQDKITGRHKPEEQKMPPSIKRAALLLDDHIRLYL